VKTQSTTPAPVETEFEFSDTTAMTCLLCARQFKTLDQLKRHNKESDLHKVRGAVSEVRFSPTTSLQKNSKDANLREVAREKAKATKAKTEQPKYRDRAFERRIMHNQPDIPIPESSSAKAAGKKRQAEGPPPPPSPPPPPVNPGQDQNNVGNKLLRMMGWTEGSGLGTDGEGRVEPM
jgi:RNA-binding protein 5/10